MEFSSTFWIQDITDWQRQEKEMHLNYADFSKLACYIFSIIQHGFGVEPSFSLDRDVISWRQSKTTGETLCEIVGVRQFAQAINRILEVADLALDHTNTENDSEIQKEAEKIIPHSMAKVHYFLEMWQGSQNLRAIQKECRAQNTQMTAMGYISDTEEMMKASWSLFQHDGVAAFILSERSPLPPPSLPPKYLLGGWTQIWNVHRIRRIKSHQVKSDEDGAPESILDTGDWLNWNGDLDNPNDSKDDCTADFVSDMAPNNSIEGSESPEQRHVSGTLNVPGLIWPTRKSKWHAEMVFMMVNSIETRRNKGEKKK